MRSAIKPNHYRYAFDSLAELQRYIADTPRTWGCKDSEAARFTEDSWDLSAGYDGAMRMARDGWLDGARKAEQALKVLTLKSPAPDTRTDFYGYMPHVPRYCAGAPDSMIRKAREASGGGGKVLTLYVPVNAVATVSALHMRNFGLGVAQYVNQLEQEGTRVELHGVLCSKLNGGRNKVTHSWRIKTADAYLDLAVLAFSIGHPAMFRRLGFALRERCDAPQDSGYGMSVACELTDLIDPPVGAYVLNGMRNAGTVAETPAKALAYVTAQIEKMLEREDAA
jgi:hypothetical protein